MILHLTCSRNRSRKLTDLVAHRGALLLAALVLALSASAALASGPSPASQGATPAETLEAVGGAHQASKTTGNLCNAAGNHCSGRWADMIDHLFTNGNGSTSIYVAPDFESEVNEKGYCTLGSGKFIKLLDYSGGERVVLDQLYLSYAMDSRFTLRLGSEANTGECILHYARMLYNEP